MALKKEHLIGGGGVGAVLLVIGALTQVDNFSREFSPHKAAFAAQQKVSQLEQYIELQQQYNQQLIQQQQSWQAWQMQQAPPPPRYDQRRGYYQDDYQEEEYLSREQDSYDYGTYR
jgi:hypothetical protein